MSNTPNCIEGDKFGCSPFCLLCGDLQGKYACCAPKCERCHTQNHSTMEGERDIEHCASNIVFQIGDALYEALPPDIAHEYFVDARQKTNDITIPFAEKLIKSLLAKATESAERRGREKAVDYIKANASFIEYRDVPGDWSVESEILEAARKDSLQDPIT